MRNYRRISVLHAEPAARVFRRHSECGHRRRSRGGCGPPWRFRWCWGIGWTGVSSVSSVSIGRFASEIRAETQRAVVAASIEVERCVFAFVFVVMWKKFDARVAHLDRPRIPPSDWSA